MALPFIVAMVIAGIGRGITLNLNPHTVLDDITPSGQATAGITFNSNGSISFTGNNSPNPNPDDDEWVKQQAGFGSGDKYEVAFTVLVSGDAPTSGAALGVYEAITTTRPWGLTVIDDTKSGVWTFRVRKISDVGEFVEANMTMTARVLP